MNVISLLTELVPCLLIGYLLGKFNENLSVVIARPLINFGIPISLMGLLLKVGLKMDLIESAVMALVAIGILMTILVVIPQLRESISCKTLQLGSGFGNTGYFGIPVALTLLPSQALGYSIGFDLGATLFIWSLGPLLLGGDAHQLLGSRNCNGVLKALIKSPASKGLIGALLVQVSPWHIQLTSFLWGPSKIVIILALVVVGMRLGWIGTSTSSSIRTKLRVIKLSLIMKLLGLPSLMFCLCLLLKLPNLMRNALVLQSAAPTAISILLISQANSHEEEKASSLVVFSTIFALITIPLWSLILKI